ncbi:MAG TPA: hypothetical protein VLM42_07210 [Bryobacteraceae bacterium]|nr:hypothetical protein [Bryobacteraceae bacterium]
MTISTLISAPEFTFFTITRHRRHLVMGAPERSPMLEAQARDWATSVLHWSL